MLRYRTSALLAMVAACSALLCSTAARAEAVSIAVLGVEPIDVPEPLSQQLNDALRHQASGAAGLKLLPGKDLIEIKMVFSCDSEATECLAKAGKSLGADKLIYGTLKKSGGKNATSALINLRLLDVRSATVEKSVTETVAKRDLAAGSVGATAGRLFAQLVEVEQRPVLTVTSEPSNAAVTVDGQLVGRTPLTLRDLSAGAHTVSVSATGHQPQSRAVELRAGANQELALSLPALTDEKPPLVLTPPKTPEPAVVPSPLTTPPPQPQGHPGRPAKIAALTLLAGGVAAGAVAIYTWRKYVDLESTAHNELQMVKDGLGAAATAEQNNFFSHPTCTPAPGLAGAAIDKYKSDCGSGETFAAATTALWVVAGAFAAGSVVSYVVGDRQAARAERERVKPSAGRILRQTLRVAPVFSTSSGGVTASFEF